MPPRSRTFVKLLSSILILGGILLFVVGARDFLGSIIGQREAAEEWAVPAAPVTAPAAPVNLGSSLARLSIPRLNKTWFVVEGVAKKQLRKGPGHMPGTAMPGAESGNCVITAHRDTHFRALKDIREGDEIVVQTRAGEFRYRVTDFKVVKPVNTTVLEPSPESVKSLITCYPFYWVGPAPRRFVVRAKLEKSENRHFTAGVRGPS
jgi:sortase A